MHTPSPPISVSSTATAQEWDDYVHKHPDGTVDHLWRWRDVVARVFSQECVYLVARRGEIVVGLLPLVLFRSRIFGRAAISLPYLNYGGLLTDDEEVAERLVDEASAAAKAFGAAYLELRHTHRQSERLPYRQHKLGLTRALPSGVETLWTDTDRKVRNQVRKAQKSGLQVSTGGAELVEDFYGVFSRNMRDLGTPVYGRRLFTETLQAFSKDARIVVVSLESRAVAAAVAIDFRGTVLVPWASSLREFRHLCPNMLLYWTMLEQATIAGMQTFDFGRSSPGGGTHQFKLQWGAQEKPLYWEYVLFTRAEAPDHGPANPKFKAMIAAWQRLPLSIANALGPSIVRNIP